MPRRDDGTQIFMIVMMKYDKRECDKCENVMNVEMQWHDDGTQIFMVVMMKYDKRECGNVEMRSVPAGLIQHIQFNIQSNKQTFIIQHKQNRLW